jgi:hypothetical protein
MTGKASKTKREIWVIYKNKLFKFNKKTALKKRR